MTCGARAGPASSISRRKRLAMPRYTASRLRYRYARSDATGGPGVCPARGPLSFSIRGSFQYADRQRQRAKYSAHRAERVRCKPHARLNVGYPEVQLKHQRAVPGREPPDALTGDSALMSVVEVRMAALTRVFFWVRAICCAASHDSRRRGAPWETSLRAFDTENETSIS